jgi:hypothetical protein
VQHRKKLCELHFNLEDAMNNFGAQCPHYPRKGSTISDIVRWIDGEVKSLSAMFARAKKIFAFYAIADILRMLQDSGCEYFSEVHLLASLSDASLLDDHPP